jgi:DNA polymerase III subunit beta
MKVSCLQENLAKGLSIVGRAVAARSTLPVLGNILLATDNGRLKLAATNLEIGITHWIGAKVESEGAITVPARQLTDYVNSLPPDRIDIELNERTQTLHLKCARYDANIKGVEASEFPIIPTVGDETNVSVDPDVLREMIEQAAFSAATDDSRPVLTGILAKFDKSPDPAKGNSVTFAAADGFRLSVRNAVLNSKLDAPITVIIPARALIEVSRITGDQEEPVQIAVTENRSQVMFHLTSTDVVSQLLDGNFPDYNQILPKGYTTRTVVNTSDLQSAVRAAAVFARDASNIVRLNIQPVSAASGEMSGNGQPAVGSGKVVVAATSAETGDNVGEIDAQVNGDPVEIAFNARFLGDVLNVLHAPQVLLETNSPASPGVIKPVGRDDFTHVIMPMHIGK